MTIEEFEKNKIRYFDYIKKHNGIGVEVSEHIDQGNCKDRGIACILCIFPNGRHICSIKTDLPLAEKKLQVWLNEHQIVTNRDKFIEIFGAEELDHTWSGVCSQICPKICPDCTSCEHNFWNKEYHEPNAGESEAHNG